MGDVQEISFERLISPNKWRQSAPESMTITVPSKSLQRTWDFFIKEENLLSAR
jgi:hypothetical protein